MSVGFSEAFSLLRKERGLSQRQAAADLGMSQALLSHYENGIREPKLDFIVKACEYYNVSADYLLGRTQIRENPSIALVWDGSGVDRLMSSISSLIDREADAGSGDLAVQYLEAASFKLMGCRQEHDDCEQLLCDSYMKLLEAKLRCNDTKCEVLSTDDKLMELSASVREHLKNIRGDIT